MAAYDFGGVKRGAVVVGINNYANLPGQTLLGAKNDAEEFYSKLVSDGGVAEENAKLLTDSGATCDNIRSAIYDILYREENSFDLAFFYFSGHGVRDPFDDLFVVPHDFIIERPYVKGITMDELRSHFRNFYKSSTLNKKKIICAFLDCCHSSTLLTGKGVGNAAQTGVGELAKTRLDGEGIIGLASMDMDEKARERPVGHLSKNDEHHHGIFTYHLIEGLEGMATDGGIINYDGLVKHMQSSMRNEKQILQTLVQAQGLIQVEISVAPNKLEEYIPTLLAGCKIINTESLLSIGDAAKKVREFEKYKEHYQKHRVDVDGCRNQIITHLGNQRGKALIWLTHNLVENQKNRERAYKIHPSLYTHLNGLKNQDLTSLENLANTMESFGFKFCLLNAIDLALSNADPDVDKIVDSFMRECEDCVITHSLGSQTTSAGGSKFTDVSSSAGGEPKADLRGII